MGFFSLQEINYRAKEAFVRFPVTLIWAILGSVYCIYLIENDTSYRFFENHGRMILTLILGVSWFIGTRFFIEQLSPKKKWNGLKLIVLGFLFVFYWHLPDFGKSEINPKFLLRFFLLLFSGHLFVLFAPFISKWNKEAYWNYLKAIGYAILRSAFFSGVLYLGLVLALLAIKSLFDVHVPDKRFGQLFVFCLGMINTWIYLSDFPKNILLQTDIHFNKALEVFVKYILIPLILLYIVILYAYGFKIVFQWELPKGWVSYLVTALALLGFVVQALIHPVQKTIKSWTINRFYPWFYLLLMPLIILLFVAIFRRIHEYGVTENRYLVLITAFWILGTSIYILSSKVKNLQLLPISLFVLALLSSFGFWSAYSISKKSQITQFQKVYKKVLENDKLVPLSTYQQLQSILSYLNERESVSELNKFVEIALTESTNDSLIQKFRPYGYLDTNKILDSLGITVNPIETDNLNDMVYYNYNNYQNNSKNYDIQGFSYLSQIYLNNTPENKQKIGDFEIRFNTKENILSLYSIDNNKKAIELSLKEKMTNLMKYGPDLTNVNVDELQLDIKNDSLSIRLFITDLAFSKTKDSISLNYGQGLLLLKK